MIFCFRHHTSSQKRSSNRGLRHQHRSTVFIDDVLNMPQPLLRSFEQLSLSEWWCHRVHALLSLYCLCHFVHRFRIFFLETDEEDMGFDPNIITATGMIQIFVPHILLQLSGFALQFLKSATSTDFEYGRSIAGKGWYLFCVRCH